MVFKFSSADINIRINKNIIFFQFIPFKKYTIFKYINNKNAVNWYWYISHINKSISSLNKAISSYATFVLIIVFQFDYYLLLNITNLNKRINVYPKILFYKLSQQHEPFFKLQTY